MKRIIMITALFLLMATQAQAVPSEEEEGSSSPYTGSANSSGPGAINSPWPLNGNSSATLDPNGIDTGSATDSNDVPDLETAPDNSAKTMNSMEPASGGGR